MSADRAPTLAQTLAEANACCRGGELARAEQLSRTVLATDPDNVDAQFVLGDVFLAQGRLSESAACWQRIVELRPENAAAHNNLGAALERLGNLSEAAGCYRAAIAIQPGLAVLHYNLGAALEQLGRLDEAEVSLRRSLAIDPRATRTHDKLAVVLARQFKLESAAVCSQQALALAPDDAEALNNYGSILNQLGRVDEALVCYQKAIAREPGRAEVHYNLGVAFDQKGRFDEAVACCKRAIALDPNYGEAHNNLGNGLMRLGQPEEAIACFRRALELQPRSHLAHSNLLLAGQYLSDVTLSGLARAHREFEKLHALPLRSCWRAFDNSPDPERKLRVGFVSADFGFHPVGYFLAGALENLDPRQVHSICYSDRGRDDAMTDRLRAAATEWRDARRLTDPQLAEQIRADKIDVLFDLAGHTSANRLMVFARKPAPIQISWMGYVGTTGLTAMDYLLADRYQVPAGCESQFAERVLRMPDGYVCYAGPSDAPPVAPPPAAAKGYVTFGSFNHPAKITPRVIDLWCEILRRVADSRLVLKYTGLDSRMVTHRFHKMFAERGIDVRRVELLGWSPHHDALWQYGRVDVALDPFPYGGGLTTCEALWMGVPVVTCPGETFASRHALGHLSNVGLTETIAADLPSYVDLACALAADLPRLARLRGQLRQQVADSPLGDANRFGRNLAELLRSIWHSWCGGA